MENNSATRQYHLAGTDNTVRNYDFTIRSNARVISSELTRNKSMNLDGCLHATEVKRKRILADLHDSYSSKFKEMFYTNAAPKDSLNRFLYEQFSLTRLSSTGSMEHSSCLIKPDNIMFMDTLKKEIYTAYPLISRAYSLERAEAYWQKEKSKIQAYLSLAKEFLDKDKIESENQEMSKKIVEKLKTSVNEYEQLFDDHRIESERLRKDFQVLFQNCKRHFEQQCNVKIRIISQFLNTKLCEVAKNLKSIAQETSQSISRCPAVSVELRFDEFSFKISVGHFEKLRKLYQKNAVEKFGIAFDEETFHSRVFSLVCRYESYFQNSLQLNEGYGMQAALPSYGFRKLVELFEVSQEMFASPFNCYFSQYCSAFLDTDVYFGSQGSFFDYEPSGGSFQCNPPFTEECIERMAIRIDLLLERANESPLSFIVVIPEWLDPPTPGLVKMSESKFLRTELTLMRGEHRYITGAQHLDNRRSFFYQSAHNSKIYILQNDLAFNKWKPTQEKIRQLENCLTMKNNYNTNRYNSSSEFQKRQREETSFQDSHKNKQQRYF